MKPGSYVLDILRNAPDHKRTIVLVRHAKRDPFGDIPDHLRDRVGITPEGEGMARELGESIKKIAPNRRLFLGHTVAKRSEMTARSIGDGHSSDNQATMLGCEPEIQSPVINLEKLVEMRNEFGWHELIRKWLRCEIPEDVIVNPRKYADAILQKLVNYPAVRPGDIFVVVAHDITLFPVIFSLFGKPLTVIEFLNGVVILADADVATIQFRNAELVCEAERLIARDNDS